MAGMKRMSLDQFGRIVQRVMETLPEELHQHIRNLVVDVEEEADPEMLRRSGYSDEEIEDGLFGLFVPFGASPEVPSEDEEDSHNEFHFDSLDQPNRLIIFKGPHEREFSQRRQFLVEVRKTVIHELAHHFGYSEKDLQRFTDHPNPFPDTLSFAALRPSSRRCPGEDKPSGRVSRRRFDRLVRRALESLPEELKAYLEYVVVDVEDEVDLDLAARVDGNEGGEFYGIVVPMPSSPGDIEYPSFVPAAPPHSFRIILYQQPLLRDFGDDPTTLLAEIRQTVIELMVGQLVAHNHNLRRWLTRPEILGDQSNRSE